MAEDKKLNYYDESGQLISSFVFDPPLPNIPAKIYPKEEPREPINIEYPDIELSLEELGSLVLQNLKGGMVPKLCIQTAFLGKYCGTLNVKATEAGKTGSLPNWHAGELLHYGRFFNLIPKPVKEDIPRPEILPVMDMLPGLAAWLLVQHRFAKIDPAVGTDYVTALLSKLKSISPDPPFNLTRTDLRNFPSYIAAYMDTRSSSVIKHFAASIDFMVNLSDDEDLLKMQFATMGTRYEDCSTIRYIEALKMIVPDQDLRLFMEFMVLGSVAKEVCQIFNTDNDITNRFSMLPYCRSLDLIQRSILATNQNPHLCTVLIVILSLTQRAGYLNIVKWDINPVPSITLGIKLANLITENERVSQRFWRADHDPHRDPNMVIAVAPHQIQDKHQEDLQRIINEMINQRCHPTALERDQIQNLVKSLPSIRRNSMAEFIMTLISTENLNPVNEQKMPVSIEDLFTTDNGLPIIDDE